ncbi:uncharacterized protein rbbp8l [Diretmus argenteus]
MEGFSELLHKLQEAHEREMERWQVKVQELSNKKGCDTKRMEELFSRNQQMREQQRLLTENIKTLENRLRAGLCDRCTVTQEVAKRRQQEYEAAQIQSLQHISILAGEMNNLKKENGRLREELRSLKGPLDLQMAMLQSKLSQTKGPRESYKPLSLNAPTPASWKTEHIVARNVPHSSSPSSSSSSTSGDVNPSRHVVRAPVPCRPRPIKSGPLSLPWSLSEASDWVTLAASVGSSLVVQPNPNPRPNASRFPNLIPTSQQANHCSPSSQGRRQVIAHPWTRRSPPPQLSKEHTLLFKMRSLSEQRENQAQAQEKKEIPPFKPERVFGEGLREVYEGPLDLSDPGRSKSSQLPKDDKPLEGQGGRREEESSEGESSAHIPVCPSLSLSSSSPPVPPSSSSTPSPNQQQEQASSDHYHKVISTEEEQEEVNGNTGQTNRKKVPVLTISLRPVVLLETLNSALQKQESSSSNGKSSSPTAEPGSSSEEQDGEDSMSGQGSSQGSKRKRASLDTDSDSNDIQQERQIMITVGPEERNPN